MKYLNEFKDMMALHYPNLKEQEFNLQEQKFMLGLAARLYPIDNTWQKTINYANVIKNYDNCRIRRSGGHGTYIVSSDVSYESKPTLWIKIRHNGSPSPYERAYFPNSDFVSKIELESALTKCFTNSLSGINHKAVSFFIHRFTQRAKKQ
jgi:hypothetical protein